MDKRAVKSAWKFLFYNASTENEKDIEYREELFQKIAEVDERIKNRTIIFSNLLFGLLNSQNEKSTSSDLLITGGDNMKYQGITIHRHKTCKTWYARYRKNGKQCYVSAKTQQECYDKLKVALKQKSKQEVKRLAEPKKKNVMTFIEWFEKWVKLYKQNVKEVTKTEYYRMLNYLKPIKNKNISEIKSLEIMELLNQIPFERTKQKVYEFISAVFNKALVNEIVTKNPMLIIEKPKHKRINGQALSNTDEAEFENVLLKNGYDLFLVCLYQGLRKGEMLALTIDDVNFEEKTLSITKSVNRFNQIDSTKNTYSNRVMPLFDKTAKILEKYKNTTGRIFNIAYQSCENKFNKIIDKFFPNKKYTIHSLRHTFITKCQELNIPLHIIQKWVGHVTGSLVTNQVYTHAREVAEVENIEKINNYK